MVQILHLLQFEKQRPKKVENLGKGIITKLTKKKTGPVEVDRFNVDQLESHFLAVVISRFDKLLPPPILTAQTVHGGPVKD